MTDDGCMASDDYCADHNYDGSCNSCYKGYYLTGGRCQVSDPFCSVHDDEGKCSSCYTGYILFSRSCYPISKLSDLAALLTPEKLQELQAENRLG